MKKQFTILGFALLVFAAVTISALAQKGKEEKGKGQQKEQKDNKGGQDKDKVRGNSDKDQGNRGKGNDDRGNDGKDNNGNKGEGNDDKDKGDKGRDADEVKNKGEDFKWTPENFRDRDKIRKNQEKVTICHKPNRDGEPGITLSVSSNSLKAHMNHGDVMGDCPNVANNRYSDDFLRRRTDYFNVLQNSQEQVIYSRSILDYALQRLTGVRSQLVTLQSSGAPVADIERRRVLVVELENDVSVLQTLVGVTANLVANRLMN